MTEQIQKAKAEPTLRQLIEQLKPQIALALPKHISVDRIARIAMTAIGNNPKLAACTPNSFLAALMQASQLGLEVNSPLGHAYLVPYGTTATLIPGYKGKIELARRSGLVRAVFAYPVFEGDEFDYGYGLEPYLKHKPGDTEPDPTKLTHVYSVAKLKDGDPVFNVLTKKQVEAYRLRSRAANDGPWVTDYIPMALKTSIHRLATWLPLSAEQARAEVIDRAAERDEQQLPAFDENIQAIFAEAEEPPKPALDRIVEIKAGAARARKAKDAPKEESTFVPIDTKAEKPAKGDVAASELYIVLGLFDAAWKTPASRALIDTWTAEQRNAAYVYASSGIGAGAAKPEFMSRGPIEREPGDD